MNDFDAFAEEETGGAVGALSAATYDRQSRLCAKRLEDAEAQRNAARQECPRGFRGRAGRTPVHRDGAA